MGYAGELWFDAQYIEVGTGSVLDEDAALGRLEVNDTAVEHIGNIVSAKEFPYTREDFRGDEVERRREAIASWERDECRAFGRWVHQLVETETDQPLTKRHFRRLDVMGLGLSEGTLLRRVGATSLAGFRQSIGVPVGYQRGLYAHWGPEEYAAYARGMTIRLGRMPGKPDYDIASKNGDGPSMHTIRDSPVNSLTQLHDQIGFPDVEAMTMDDMVCWGSNVRWANGGIPLVRIVADILSRRHRGPSPRLLHSTFGSWSNYVARVNEWYDYETEAEERLHKSKLELYAEMLSAGKLPPEAASLTEKELFALGGKHQVIEALAPNITPGQKSRAAGSSSGAFISALMRAKVGLRAGRIELEASLLGVFEDIWPQDDGLQHLVVSKEELKEERQRDAKYRVLAKNR